MTPAHLRLLVVDDDPVARLVLSRILTRLGHQTDTAVDVASGLDLAVTAPPDLVFSDLQLPDGTADDLLAAMRRSALATPLVVVTGVAEMEQFRAGHSPATRLDHPARSMTLMKPVDSRSVSACISTVLEGFPAR